MRLASAKAATVCEHFRDHSRPLGMLSLFASTSFGVRRFRQPSAVSFVSS